MSEPAVSLPRYAQRIGYRECAFFGINHPDNDKFECRQIWTQSQREMVDWALREAQEELEQEIGFFLAPSWVENERHDAAAPIVTRWSRIIAPGVKKLELIEPGVSVDYSADPAMVSVTANCDNPVLYHAGTEQVIIPTSVESTGGVVTFSIPWCRLVAPEYQDNPQEGWHYSDVATWGAKQVDVYCLSNDESQQATLVWRNRCAGCEDIRETGCVYVMRETPGIVTYQRADYVKGLWQRRAGCLQPDYVLLSYYSGMTPLTRQAEDAIIRLAHAKMPDEPCGCAVTQRLWQRDRRIGEVLTRERINCPFGMNDGAWIAWRFAQAMRVLKARPF